MKFFCRYCKIEWVIELDGHGFERIFELQAQNCYVTRRGVCHELRAVIE